jgi:WD40 repeat protein
LAVTPDGRTLIATGMDGCVRLIDLDARRQRETILAHRGGTLALGLSGDGRHFITGGADGRARVWDIVRFKEVQTHEAHTKAVSAVALSPDGRLAASGDYSGVVHLWEASSGKERFRQVFNPHRVTGLSFSTDGSLLAGGGLEKAIIPNIGGFNRPSPLCLWRVADGRKEVLRDTAEAVHFLPGQGGLIASCNTLAVDRDARGTSLHGGSQTILWDPWRKRRPFFVKNYYHGIAVTPDGRYAATSWGSDRFYSSALAQDSPARGIHLWELASGKEVWALPVSDSAAKEMALTPEGRTLVAGREGGTLAYHDLRPEGWQPPAGFSDADFARAWQALGGSEAARAYAAVWDLVAQGDQSVRRLRETWKPTSQAERLRRLVADLDSDDFAIRRKARQTIEEHIEEAEPLLLAALEKPASAEQRRAVKGLIARLDGPASLNRQREARALTVLERIGTPDARRFLRQLAEGPVAYLAEQARLAETRLARRAAR